MKNDLPKEAYKFYLEHPVEFAQEQILCLSSEDVKKDILYHRLEPQTKSILYNVSKHDYVSVFAGRGCTTTISLALLALWWLWTRNDAKVIAVATEPELDRLESTLWAEVKKWLDKSNLTDEIILCEDRIFHVDPKMNSYGYIVDSKDPEFFAGICATHVLWILDEPANTSQDILDVILSSMSDTECKIIMAGKPINSSGAFYETQNKFKNIWECLNFNSENSEIVNKKWLTMMQNKYSKDSDTYRVHVLGLPPLKK